MTREEALAKDDALVEIIRKVRDMPALEIVVGGVKRLDTYVSRESVVQLVQGYGFNDSFYVKPKRASSFSPDDRRTEMTETEKHLVKAGVKNLRKFGYLGCTAENILTDAVYSQFFASMLDNNKGHSARADEAIDSLKAKLAASTARSGEAEK